MIPWLVATHTIKPPMADDRMELGDGRIEAAGAMVGLRIDGHATTSPDCGKRRQESRHEQAKKLTTVVLKAASDRQRAILRARCRVRRMVWVAEQEPRRYKDKCVSGRRTRRMLMS